MRTLRLTVAGTVILALLGGLGGMAAAQDESNKPVTDDYVTPAWVSGTVEFAWMCREPVESTLGDVTQLRGIMCAPQIWKSDDPRFDGEAAVAHDSDTHRVDDDVYLVTSASFEVSTDAGGWDCTDGDALNRGRADDLFGSTVEGQYRMNCAGTGRYEGTTAILFVDYSADPKTFEGLVFPGAAPPLPEASFEFQ